MGRPFRILVPLVVLLIFAYFLTRGGPGGTGERPISYSQFVDAVQSERVLSGSFQKDVFHGTYTSGGGRFTVDLPPTDSRPYGDLVQLLLAHHVNFDFPRPLISEGLGAMLVSFVLPLGVIFFFWMFFLRQAQQGRR